jgi:Domain of unknown function (DUF5664)
MSIGDVNSAARGSGARFNAGKHPLKFTPLHLLEPANRVWAYGANKYAAWNWAKGMPWSVPYECMLRHLAAWYRGEDIDPESGESHLGHIMCNVLMLEHFKTAFTEGDDRPKLEFQPGGLPYDAQPGSHTRRNATSSQRASAETVRSQPPKIHRKGAAVPPKKPRRKKGAVA